ncbi:MAG: hypothetical protein K0Q79_3625 [Flavipsychrobacter sp.]|jgi:hypothetical protein|nr:hypothetical protein [Flavipsychrobacter sp.]
MELSCGLHSVKSIAIYYITAHLKLADKVCKLYANNKGFQSICSKTLY